MTSPQASAAVSAVANPTRFERIKFWWQALRMRTLTLAVASIGLGQVLAWSSALANDHFSEHFSGWLALLILVCTLCLQLAVNLANDLFDYLSGVDGPQRLGPQRAAQSGWLSVAQLRRAVMVLLGLSALSGAYLVVQGGWPYLFLGFACLLAVLAYSGGPWPLASHGLGEVTVFLFFGVLAVVGGFSLQSPLSLQQLPAQVWLAAVQMGCFSAAVMLVNNLRDIDSDGQAGKFTLAWRLGDARSRRLYVLLLIVPFISVWLADGGLQAMDAGLAVNLALVPAMLLVRAVFRRQGEQLNKQLAQTAGLCLLFALLRCVDIVLLNWV